jgi:hypothetical protein
MLFAATAAAALAACGDDTIGPSDLTQADLQGNWKVTSFEYTKDGDDSKHYDLVKDGGYNITAIVQANGAYTLTFNHAGVPTTTETGTITAAGGTVTLTRSGGAQPQAINDLTLEGNTLTFKDENQQYDFDNDNTAEAADLQLVWEKQ